MDQDSILEQAFATTGSVLQHVEESDLDLPTPCTDWNVRALINHIVGGTEFFAVTAESGTAPKRDFDDVPFEDVMSTFEAGSKRAVTAFGQPGTADKAMALPFGTIPGSQVEMIAALDTFTHGWDLARSIGQSTNIHPGLATQILEVARVAIPDALRGPSGQAPFGMANEVVDPSTPADALAAFLGRRV